MICNSKKAKYVYCTEQNVKNLDKLTSQNKQTQWSVYVIIFYVSGMISKYISHYLKFKKYKLSLVLGFDTCFYEVLNNLPLSEELL